MATAMTTATFTTGSHHHHRHRSSLSKSPRSSPTKLSFDPSIASVLAGSPRQQQQPQSPQHRRQRCQSPHDTLSVAPATTAPTPRTRQRDRGKSTNASTSTAATATSKRLPPLPLRAVSGASVRPKTSPSPASPVTSAAAPGHPPHDHPPPPDPASPRQRAFTAVEPLRSPPLAKRPPASRSCHGVETSSGPPPALSLRPPLSTADGGGALDVRRKATPPSWAHGLGHDAPGAESAGETARLTPNALAQLEALVQKNADTARNLFHVHSRDRASTHESGDASLPVPTGLSQRGPTSRGALESDVSTQTPRPMRVEASMSGDATRPRDERAQDTTLGSRRSQSSGEDLFLSLARDDEVDAAVAENAAAQRRSKVGLPAHRQTQSSSAALDAMDRQSEHTIQAEPNGSRLRRPSLQSVVYSEVRTPGSAERTPTRDRKYPASAHPLDQQRAASRISGGFSRSGFAQARALRAREMSPESPASVQDRSSRTSGPTSQIYAPQGASRQATSTVNGQYNSSPIATRTNSNEPEEASPPLDRQGGTESTISTTAPSTLWDEVGDMNSRIRRLEIMCNIPQSHAAGARGATAVNGERPRTATTTVTTMSSSPKRAMADGSSPVTSSADVDDANAPHPLLKQALAKSKACVSAEAYQALETVAADALGISKVTHSTLSKPPPSAANGISLASDRQLRRKADALCRSLTELCIALANTPPPPPPPTETQDATPSQPNRRSLVAIRPGSRDAHSSGNDSASIAAGRFARARSMEPETQQATPPPTASARALSRLDARRSLRASESPTTRSPLPLASQPAESNGAPSLVGTPSGPGVREAAPTPTQATLSRTSTVLGRIHRQALAAQADGAAFDPRLQSPLPPADERDGAYSVAGAAAPRPISRAATDLGRARSMASRRQSREYYSQHPLPERSPRESLLATPRLQPQVQQQQQLATAQQPQIYQQQQQPQSSQLQTRHATPTAAGGPRRSYLSRPSAGPSGLVQPRTYLDESDGSPVTVVPARASTVGARPGRLSSISGGVYGGGGEARGSLATRPERRSFGLPGSLLRHSRRDASEENAE